MALDFEESLKVVTGVTPASDFTSSVPRDGISLNFLLHHFDTGCMARESMQTIYDLEAYVLRLTSRWVCSFTELLKCHPIYKSDVVETAEFFVSLAYSTNLETLFNALDKYRRKIGKDDIYLWISVLSVNQHFGRTEGEKHHAPVVYPSGWFKNAFKDCIDSIGHVLFVMSPLNNPVALKRVWCIFELYLTITTKQCKLDIVLSEEDEKYLIDNLIKDTDCILDYIDSVDSESARSSNIDQEEKLRSQIKALNGGFKAIDGAVKDRLREWFAHAATEYIDAHREEYKQNLAKYISLLESVGKMLHHAGRLKQAQPLLAEALELSKSHYGMGHAT